MTRKKSKSADLERKRFAFFQLGLIVALATILLAFEYSVAKPGEPWVELELPEEPVVSFMLTEVEQEPKQERPHTGSIPTPVVPVMLTIIDSVIVEEGSLDPYKEVYVPFQTPGEISNPLLPPEDPLLISPTEEWTRPPLFPGGDLAMNRFIMENIRYPQNAIDANTQGTVYVEFVVNRDGSICDVVAKNKPDAQLEKEAIRVVSIMPNWQPGEQAGKPVRVRYVIPIRFTLH
jgi:periplasmic protein TonB